MKQLTLLAAFIPTLCFAQTKDDYNDLPIPQTSLLGKPLSSLDIKKGRIKPNASSPKKNFSFDIIDGANYSSNYSNKLNTLIIPSFKKTKIRIVDSKIHGLKIKSLSPENFFNGNISPGTVFAYDGIVADSVDVTFRTSKSSDIKPSEAIDLFKEYIPAGTWSILSNTVSKVTINGKDSIEKVIRIKNPDVIFRARFIKYNPTQPINGGTWEGKFKLFDYPNTTNLTITGKEDNSRSESRTPKFAGGKEDYSRPYFFKVVGEPNDLRLIFALDESTNLNTDEGYTIIKEIPIKNKNIPREYSLGYRTVDHYVDQNGNERVIKLSVYAKQIDDTTIQLINCEKEDKKGECTEPATYMKYPYFTFEYITKYN